MDAPAGTMLKCLLRLFLACALLYRLLRRTGLPAGLDQLLGALGRDRFDRVAGAQAGVRLAVRDVGAEAAFLEDDRLAADRIVAQLLERRLGLAAPGARLGELRQGLVERDREELLLGVQ